MLEYCGSASIWKVMHSQPKNHRFSNQELAWILRCVAQGLEYLHRHRVLHRYENYSQLRLTNGRDLKAENVLLANDGVLKLSVFHAFLYRLTFNSGLRSF